MLLRISLIVAIVAGLAVAGLNMLKVKEKVTTLQANLAEQTAGRQKAESELADTRRTLQKTEKDLASTKQTLETTTAERDQALTEVAALNKRSEKLTDDLNKTRRERDDAQAELAAFTGTGFTPPQIIGFGKQIKGLQDNLAGSKAENELLGKELKKTKTRLAIYETPDYRGPLPSSLRGKVLVSDPKWNFVVINVGEDQGVLEQGELLVNRDGKLVAKVKIRTVQKDRSIANIVPGWQLGEVVEGDQVIPAHPAS
jgi:cell shape-determining protein MreC